MLVYVINRNDEPLMPTTLAKANSFIKKGKAKVIRKLPLTIKILNNTGKLNIPMTLGIDTGSKNLGAAVVSDKGDVLYISQVMLRNDITNKMERRSKYRKMRRSKLRYRPNRYLNRRNSSRTKRFSPTIKSKINSHLKEIKLIKSILPITKVILETTNFDIDSLKTTSSSINEESTNQKFANIRSFILARDNYLCQMCRGKSNDKHLHVHHIIFRSKGGSDDPSNLVCLCKKCHDELHTNKKSLTFKGLRTTELKHATHTNSIGVQLLKKLTNAEKTFGYITKEIRQNLKLPKEHYFDAVAIASQNSKIVFKTNEAIIKRCVAKGDFQRTIGVRSQIKIPTGKINGFKKLDKVKYRGEEYFIKGRMATGYAILMDIFGKTINLKPIPKFDLMARLESRKTWLQKRKIITF